MSKHWDPRQSGWTGQWDGHRWPVRPHRKSARRRPLRNWQLNVLALLAVSGVIRLYDYANPLPSETTPTSEDRGQTTDPLAVRVIDGDTFDYGGMRIRIADIDTPEVNGRCSYETDLAAQATSRMDALLHQGSFELHPTPDGRDEDRHGRKLRIVTRDGRSVGDILVAEGLARTWTGRREPWCV